MVNEGGRGVGVQTQGRTQIFLRGGRGNFFTINFFWTIRIVYIFIVYDNHKRR